MSTTKSIEILDDMHLSSKNLFKQYYDNYSAGNISQIDVLLNNNPQLGNQLMNAENSNGLINGINYDESIIKTNVDEYLATQFDNFQDLINYTKIIPTYSSSTQYNIHNFVYYNNMSYYCYKTPPIGTLPTNTNYWIGYDIKGLKGYGGTNLNFKGLWNSSYNYSIMDSVSYGNKLFFAIANNVGHMPDYSHYPWLPIMFPLQPNKTKIQKETPSVYMANGDMWFKIIKGNDIKQTTWVEKENEPIALYASSYFVYQNSIHIVGGDNGLDIRQDNHQVYDTVTNTWSTAANMPEPRAGAACFTIGAKGYVVGGLNNAATTTNTCYIYDFNTNSWSQGATAPFSLWSLNGGCSDGNLGYVIGGASNSGLPSNITFSYNPANDSWSQLADCPASIEGNTVQYNNGKIYSAKGISLTTGIGTNSLYIYDIATNTWSSGADGIIKCEYLSSFINNGKIYCFGGANIDQYSIGNCEIYDIATNTWSNDIPLINTRNSLCGCWCNGHGYAIGGININADFGVFGHNEQYTVS